LFLLPSGYEFYETINLREFGGPPGGGTPQNKAFELLDLLSWNSQ